MSSDAELLRRCLEFDHEYLKSVATMVVEVEAGQHLSVDGCPLVYDHNLVLVRPDWGGSARELVAAVESLDWGRARHRKFRVDDPGLAAEVAAITDREVWTHEELAVLVHDGSEPAQGRCAPVSHEVAAQFVHDAVTSRAWGVVPGVVGQFERLLARIAEATELEVFGVVEDERAVGCVRLYGDGGDVVQVEELEVLEPAQGRGVGTTLLATVTEAAWHREPEVVFLIADGEDWPKDWYARNGWRRIGSFWMFGKGTRLESDDPSGQI